MRPTRLFISFAILFSSLLFADNHQSLNKNEENLLEKIDELSQTDLMKALSMTDVAISEYPPKEHSLILGNLYHRKGNLNMLQGRYAQARDAYYSADQNFSAINYSLGRTKALINIATLYQMEKEYQKASSAYKEALKQAYLLPNKDADYLIPNILLNQANLFDEEGKRMDAIHQFKEVVTLCKTDNMLSLKGKAYHNLGNQYLKIDVTDSANYFFKQAYAIKKLTGDRRGEINSLLAFAQVQLISNQFDAAEKYYLEAEQIAISLKAYQDLVNVYNNLFQLYQAKGDFENALKYHVLFKEQSDELIQTAHEQTVNFIEKNHQLELDQQDLQTEKEDQQELIFGLTTAFILFVIISVLIFRMQRLKAINAKQSEDQLMMEKELLESEQLRVEEQYHSLQNDISFKDKELTTNVMHLMQKNELINNVSEELMTLDDPQMDSATRKKIRSIVYNLQTSGSGEIWKELEVRFEQVHHQFFDQLQKEHPNLTPNEKKLCAFLKLNLSTKDISNITHQSVKSIQIARYRLRKKLGLINTDIDFQTFLSKYDGGNLTLEEVREMV
ncbi:tetratricopeptide repeat protein [Flammeovirga sp. MY04]|uniref:tetratricopeptide repeat protein n=1 Tax=Flammeovirga sp. MY04 TaxID=1191459 RepID=UPI000825DA04|nr:tetratricopeptide repeat protein [Flammeovirga sp. MY04]ANQ51500.2 tetratricopeptide repeat protein [Flammeovirga sp. MY04]